MPVSESRCFAVVLVYFFFTMAATVPFEGRSERLIAKVKTYDAYSQKWGSFKNHYWHSDSNDLSLELRLKHGGSVTLFPNCISENRALELSQELLDCDLFRQYQVQCTDEPRIHFLLHHAATLSFSDTQPGYRYGGVTMKARPLSLVPQVESVAKDMGKLASVACWNIGVNPVWYRDGNDKIGRHADDAQGETEIFSLLIDSPVDPRRIVITVRNKKRKKEKLIPVHGDEIIELFLLKTDGYMMDGQMQNHYLHEVPASKKHVGIDDVRRLTIVFRSGKEKYFSVDSGKKAKNFSPRNVFVAYTFGLIHGLCEGQCYSRIQMKSMGAHKSIQRGVSGNKKLGCDAIIISRVQEHDQGDDDPNHLTYVVKKRVGAGALQTSMDEQLPVRVFRFSHKTCRKYFVYDGLYMVMSSKLIDQESELFVFVLKKY